MTDRSYHRSYLRNLFIAVSTWPTRIYENELTSKDRDEKKHELMGWEQKHIDVEEAVLYHVNSLGFDTLLALRKTKYATDAM